MGHLVQEARKMVHLIRRMGRSIAGREPYYRATFRCPKVSAGNANASFVVNPALLEAKSIVYSVGIGTDISFDLACIDKFSLHVHAFDPTPRSVQWLATQRLPPQFHFHNYGLANYDGELTFYAPENPAHVSYSATRHTGLPVSCPVRKLSTIMKELEHTHIDLLKVDVEGAEYDVIENMLAESIFPAQFCVEFHHRWPQIGVERTTRAIANLQASGYRIFHVSESGEEFSFIKL